MTSHWILGPGSIGRLLAHSLSTLADITAVSRRALPALQTITTLEGEPRSQHLNVITTSQLLAKAPAPPAFLHITTKAVAAEAALESVASILSTTTPLVLWQNGFLAQPRLTELWPGPVLCATTTEGAYLTGDDGIVHAGRGHTFVGDLENRHGALAKQIALKLTQAGLAATAVDDIRSRLWQKLAVNAAINPLVALYGVRNGELRDATYAGRVETVVKEVAAIMLAEGIQASNGGSGLDAWLALVWDVIEMTANNKASMLQDVEAKRLTERGAILGPLIESGERHGVDCEVLRGLDSELAVLEAGF